VCSHSEHRGYAGLVKIGSVAGGGGGGGCYVARVTVAGVWQGMVGCGVQGRELEKEPEVLWNVGGACRTGVVPWLGGGVLFGFKGGVCVVGD